MSLIKKLFGDIFASRNDAPMTREPDPGQPKHVATATSTTETPALAAVRVGPSRKPPTFAASWTTAPPLVKPEPRWIRSIADLVGVVLDDGVSWPVASAAKFHPPTSNDFDGRTYLSWGEGQSPVKQHTATMAEFEGSVSELAEQLRKGLCRPGEPSDYHFAIQDAASRAFAYRGEDPCALQWVEWFCWLNIRFIEAVPSAVRFDSKAGHSYVRVLAFGTLVGMYEDEGMLEEANLVADRAAQFNNLVGGEGIKERIATLASEDVDAAG